MRYISLAKLPLKTNSTRKQQQQTSADISPYKMDHTTKTLFAALDPIKPSTAGLHGSKG